jgi:flagellar protein FlaG
MAQATQPVRLASDGAPNVVVSTPSNVAAQPSASLELPQTAVKPAAEQQPSTEQLKNVVDGINKTLKQANRNLEFSVDKSTNRQVVKLVDTETGDVVRQFPTEEVLAISRAIDQVQQGLLLKQKA